MNTYTNQLREKRENELLLDQIEQAVRYNFAISDFEEALNFCKEFAELSLIQ